MSGNSCCCGTEPGVSPGREGGAETLLTPYDKDDSWVVGELALERGRAPVVSTRLSAKDKLGAIKVRCGIGRTDYQVQPGLYAVGAPGPDAPVLVSANYKLTFDTLRKELTGLDCWLLILDTKGVNVWCAAGKGTFSTRELLKRLAATRLPALVTTRTLILPQLGASGVSAPEIKRKSGFTVVYGPVRASDIAAFLAAGNQATEEMRTVRFTAKNRLILTPVELAAMLKPSLMLCGVLFLLNLIAARPFGVADLLAYAGAVLCGTVVTPLLLPYIPGRAFAVKGWLLGLVWAAHIVWRNGWLAAGSVLLGAGYLLVLPALSAFLAMNFTGSSTYTSFSGVTKEMRAALPPIIAAAALGVALLLIKSFIG